VAHGSRYGGRSGWLCYRKSATQWKDREEGSKEHGQGCGCGKLRKVSKADSHEVPFLKKNAHGPFKVTLPAAFEFHAGQL